MTTPASGYIGISHVLNEFQTGSGWLRSYAGIVPGVPTSGVIKLSDFYNKTRARKAATFQKAVMSTSKDGSGYYMPSFQITGTNVVLVAIVGSFSGTPANAPAGTGWVKLGSTVTGGGAERNTAIFWKQMARGSINLTYPAENWPATVNVTSAGYFITMYVIENAASVGNFAGYPQGSGTAHYFPPAPLINRDNTSLVIVGNYFNSFNQATSPYTLLKVPGNPVDRGCSGYLQNAYVETAQYGNPPPVTLSGDSTVGGALCSVEVLGYY